MTEQTTTENFDQAVAFWTTHYVGAGSEAALARREELREHGIPEDRTAEWLGANLALTPVENRCAHYGDRTNCPQCLGEQMEREDEEKKHRQENEALREENTKLRRVLELNGIQVS